ncbi:MAG: hypothetical protein ACRDWY_12380 [Actinomycetes bacterium]
MTAQQQGFFYRWQALECGHKPKEIAALLRAKEWQVVRHGAYAPREVLEGLDQAARHVLTVRAAVGNLDGLVFATHHSALAALDVPLWGVDLGQVHVHRDDSRASRRSAGVVHHVGPLPESQIIEVKGLLVSIPERGVVDASRTVGFEAGVVLADGARRLFEFDDDCAEEILDRQRDWSHSVHSSRVLRFSDGRAQTVGESRARVLLARIGVPKPTLQREIRDAGEHLLGITDFYIEEYDTAAEFDGRLKYGRALYEKTNRLDHEDIGDIVWQEKRREDSIRDEGSEMVRIVWSELDGRDRAVRARFDRAFERVERRRRAS